MSPEFAIGAPGEDLGSAVDAGTVSLYDTGLLGDGGSTRACPSRLIRQGGLAGGRAEAGDRLGADLGVRLFGEDLLIAAPGEDVGAAANAGVVNVVSLGRIAQRPTEQFSLGSRVGLHYATLP